MNDHEIFQRAERLREALFEAALTIDALLAICAPSEAPRPHSDDPKPQGVIAQTEQAAIEVIEEVGHALRTNELLRLVKRKGVQVGGLKPASTLSARLSNSRRLRRTERGWMTR